MIEGKDGHLPCEHNIGLPISAATMVVLGLLAGVLDLACPLLKWVEGFIPHASRTRLSTGGVGDSPDLAIRLHATYFDGYCSIHIVALLLSHCGRHWVGSQDCESIGFQVRVQPEIREETLSAVIGIERCRLQFQDTDLCRGPRMGDADAGDMTTVHGMFPSLMFFLYTCTLLSQRREC